MGLDVNVLAAMGRHDPLTTSRGAAEGALRPGPHDTPRQPLTLMHTHELHDHATLPILTHQTGSAQFFPHKLF